MCYEKKRKKWNNYKLKDNIEVYYKTANEQTML